MGRGAHAVEKMCACTRHALGWDDKTTTSTTTGKGTTDHVVGNSLSNTASPFLRNLSVTERVNDVGAASLSRRGVFTTPSMRCDERQYSAGHLKSVISRRHRYRAAEGWRR